MVKGSATHQREMHWRRKRITKQGGPGPLEKAINEYDQEQAKKQARAERQLARERHQAKQQALKRPAYGTW